MAKPQQSGIRFSIRQKMTASSQFEMKVALTAMTSPAADRAAPIVPPDDDVKAIE